MWKLRINDGFSSRKLYKFSYFILQYIKLSYFMDEVVYFVVNEADTFGKITY